MLTGMGQRSEVPNALSDANATSVDTSTLGIPVANYPSDSCTNSEFFASQHLLFNIALCGGMCLSLQTAFQI